MKKNFYPRLFEFERQSSDVYDTLQIGSRGIITKFLDNLKNIIYDFSYNLDELDHNYINLSQDMVPRKLSVLESAELLSNNTIAFDFREAMKDVYYYNNIPEFPVVFKGKKYKKYFESDRDFFDFLIDYRGAYIPKQFMSRATEIFDENPLKYITPDIFLKLNLSEKRAQEILVKKPAKMLGKYYGEFDFVADSIWVKQTLAEYFKTAIIRKNWIDYNLSIKTLYRDFPSVAISYVKKFQNDGNMLLNVKNKIPELFKAAIGDNSDVVEFRHRTIKEKEKNLKEAHKILMNYGFEIRSSNTQKRNGNIKAYLPEEGRSYMLYNIGNLKRDGANGNIKSDPLMTYTDMAKHLIKYINK